MEDGGLLEFASFKDSRVPMGQVVEAEAPRDVHLVVAEGVDCKTHIEDVYGVVLEGDDHDTGDEDLDNLTSQIIGTCESS